MIYVNRDSVGLPAVLSSDRWKSEKSRLIGLLGSASEEHLAQLRVTFDNKLWHQFLEPLEQLFHHKCAYCESSVRPGSSAVEHYRPRQGVRSSRDSRGHLYYAWLAYEWDNLLLVCQECNTRYGTRQPGDFLAGGELAPFLASVAECRQVEVPKLIDPCFDDPAEHLLCVRDGSLVPVTSRARYVVDALGLNSRPELTEARVSAWRQTDLQISDAIEDFTNSSEQDVRILWEAVLKLTELHLPHLTARRAAIVARSEQLEKLGLRSFGPQQWPRPTVSAVVSDLKITFSIEDAYTGQTTWGKFPGKAVLPTSATNRIRRISIRNFKSIEAIDVDVPETEDGAGSQLCSLALIGENATGKSSILEAVALALIGIDEASKLDLNWSEFLRRDSDHSLNRKSADSADIKVTMNHGGQISFSIDADGRLFGTRRPSTVVVGYGPRRYFSKNRSKKRFSAPWHRVRSMFEPQIALPNPTRWLVTCTAHQFNIAVRALRALLLLPDAAVVSRKLSSSAAETGAVFLELNGRMESIDSLSEGYKTVVAMGVDVIREMLHYYPDLETARGVVLIDELDTHLHPRWKMRIAQRLRRAMPNVQFLTSTHDPLCLRGFRDGEVVVLRRIADAGVEQVKDLPNVQGLSVQQLLTSEFFGLYSAEDPELDEDVAEYTTLLAKQSRSADEEAELTRHRVQASERLLLGSTPVEQLLQEALGTYLMDRRGASEARSKHLRQEAVRKAVEVWQSIDTSAPDDSNGDGHQ